VSDTARVDLEAVIAAAGSVQDPEIRRTLTEMDLMDGAEVDEKELPAVAERRLL